MSQQAEEFLIRHRLLPSFTPEEELIRNFTEAMLRGLSGSPGGLRMIPTYIEAGSTYLRNETVLAIDAGGTNFRAALVRISSEGKIIMQDTVNRRMPGLDGEISAAEFFSTIAGYLRPLAESVERIGFCFSYPTEIFPDGDGRLITFCKEVRAPGVHGMIIGKELLKALGMQRKKIVLLNDTVATLLAGKAGPEDSKYSSHIGFILGTGTNTCYIEHNENIVKCPGLKAGGSMVINVESGDYGAAPRTLTDELFDAGTADPGRYMFEKMFSGGYLGSLVLFVLRKAASEGVFSAAAAKALGSMTGLSTQAVSDFMSGSDTEPGSLMQVLKGTADREACRCIIENMIVRAATLSAAALAAVVLKSGGGKEALKPVLITVEGTTFYRLWGFRDHFEAAFSLCLSGASRRYTEFSEVAGSGLAGAALAALIN